MKILFLLTLVCFLILGGIQVNASTSMTWQRSRYGLNESEMTCLAVNPSNSRHLLVTSSRRIYQSENGGRFFRPIAELPRVNHLYFSIFEPEIVFAVTDDGLYAVSLDGHRVEQRFNFSSEEGGRGLIMAEGSKGLYLGTTLGVYFQGYSERNWTRLSGVMSDKPVLDIRSVSGKMYFLTTGSLIRLDETEFGFDEVFHFTQIQLDESETADEEQDALSSETVEVSMDVAGGKIFLAANGGIFVSADFGESWQRYSTGSSFPNDVFRMVMFAPDPLNSAEGCEDIWVGTASGVYLCSDGKWQMLRVGWEGSRVNDVIVTKNGTVYAATDKGLFSIGGELESYVGEGAYGASLATEATDPLLIDVDLAAPIFSQRLDDQAEIAWADLEERLSHEPSIQMVQRWAIDYAEVSNDKIKSWRHLAKKRALFPSLSVSTGNDQSRTVSDSMYGSSSNGGTHYMAPDSKDYRQNIDFDASLSWDFSDWVWSSDQTSIDSRAKLMVELRESILNQVTRLYFERRRLVMETMLTEVLSGVPQLYLDRQLRIAELTALLDSFTGEKFSRHLEEVTSTVSAGNEH